MPTTIGPSYHKAHKNLRVMRGSAKEYDCEFCLESANQWAYDYTDPNVLWGWASTRKYNKSPYSLDVDRYFPVCAPCHARFDKAVKMATTGSCGGY